MDRGVVCVYSPSGQSTLVASLETPEFIHGALSYLLKMVAILLFVPLYPLVLFARWHEVSSNGVKMNWKKESVDHWDDLKRVLKKKPSSKA